MVLPLLKDLAKLFHRKIQMQLKNEVKKNLILYLFNIIFIE
tara:strand:+ start:35 stop:157 length:123 start_codon:yes stop_codon:yes gene_type:complete